MCQKFFEIYHGAGIDGASSHSGRRGFLTRLSERGISVRVLQELANHKSLAVTQRYIEVSPAMLRQAVEVL
jgi:integrase/recombinase XerD